MKYPSVYIGQIVHFFPRCMTDSEPKAAMVVRFGHEGCHALRVFAKDSDGVDFMESVPHQSDDSLFDSRGILTSRGAVGCWAIPDEDKGKTKKRGGQAAGQTSEDPFAVKS